LIASEEAKLMMDNLDDKVMRYKAMDITKAALYNKKFVCNSTKYEPNDMASQIASKWFSQKPVEE
jgi:hypothetical protein